MRKLRRLFSVAVCFVAMLTCLSLQAAPAGKKPVTKKQSDGSVITFVLQGDERVHWATTLDGYTLLQNSNKDWVYATRDSHGDLVPSSLIANNESARNAKETTFVGSLQKDLRFSPLQVKKKTSQFNAKLKGADDHFPTTGTDSLLIILVEFQDVQFNYTQQDFVNLTSQSNYMQNGSFKDFYSDNSDGQLNLGIRVVGPYTLPENMVHYGEGSEGYVQLWDFVNDAVTKADDDVDFSHFDNNSDGYVDGIFIFYAGTPENTTGNSDEIWPHQWTLDGIEKDGVYISRYACAAEMTQPDGPVTGIGTMCHEFGHMLGLPDMYDTDYAGTGGQSVTTGYYDLMASGSHSTWPPYLSAMEQYMLGWLTFDTLSNATEEISLPVINGHNDKAYLIDVNDDEFYVIEARSKQNKWDRYIPSQGMLIYHGLNQKIYRWYYGYNDINVNPNARGWYIVPSDGITDHGDGAYAAFAGVSQITSFSPNSLSKPILHSGDTADITITSIQWKNDSVMQFDYNVNKAVIELSESSGSDLGEDNLTFHGIIVSKGSQAITKKGFIYSSSQSFTFAQATAVYDNNLNDTLYITATANNLTAGKYYYKAFLISGTDTVYSSVRSIHTRILGIEGPEITFTDEGDTEYRFELTMYDGCEKYYMFAATDNYVETRMSYWDMTDVEVMDYMINTYGYEEFTYDQSRWWFNLDESYPVWAIYILAISTNGDSIVYKHTFNVAAHDPEVTISDVVEGISDYNTLTAKWYYTKNDNTDYYYAGAFVAGFVDNIINNGSYTLESVLDYLIDNNYVYQYTEDDSAQYNIWANVDIDIYAWAVNDQQGITKVTKKTFRIDKGTDGYAIATPSITSTASATATLTITMNEDAAYYYYLYATERIFEDNGIYDTNDVIEYCKNLSLSNTLVSNGSYNLSDLTVGETYWLFTVPYNSNQEVGKIGIVSFKFEDLSTCGNSSVEYDGTTYDSAGFYEIDLTTVDGYDSTTFLTVIESSAYDINRYDTLHLTGEGTDYSLDNIESLQTIFGCDSTVTSHLYVTYTEENPSYPYVAVSDVEDGLSEYNNLTVQWSYTKNDNTDYYYTGVFDDNYIENIILSGAYTEEHILDYLIDNNAVVQCAEDTSVLYYTTANADVEIFVWAVNEQQNITTITKQSFRINKGTDGYAIATPTLTSYTDSTAKYKVTMNQNTAYYYILSGTESAFEAHGLTDTNDVVAYCNNNIPPYYTRVASGDFDLTGLTAGETYLIYTVPYNANKELGKIGILRFTIDTSIKCENVTVTMDESRCYGEEFVYEGQTYTTTQAIITTYTKEDGCDSTVIINLSVKPEIKTYDTVSFCENSSIDYGGTNYANAGEYTIKLTSYEGCDSTILLTVIENPVYNITLYDTVEKEGDSMDYSYDSVETLQTIHGCDSVITTHIFVKYFTQPDPCENVTVTMDESICNGEEFVYDGQTYTTTQMIVNTYTKEDGCDSTVVINLTVRETYKTVVYDTIKTNPDAEVEYYETVIDSLQSEYGCDSIVTRIIYTEKDAALTDVSATESVKVYPNPAKDKVTVEAYGDITVVNNKGQAVISFKDIKGFKVIDVKDWESGVYYIITDKQTVKLIIE